MASAILFISITAALLAALVKVMIQRNDARTENTQLLDYVTDLAFECRKTEQMLVDASFSESYLAGQISDRDDEIILLELRLDELRAAEQERNELAAEANRLSANIRGWVADMDGMTLQVRELRTTISQQEQVIAALRKARDLVIEQHRPAAVGANPFVPDCER